MYLNPELLVAFSIFYTRHTPEKGATIILTKMK